MGLDTVELVMRCEEEFLVSLPDEDCAQVYTVGELYELICKRMGLEPLKEPNDFVGQSALQAGSLLKLKAVDLSAENVWATLIEIILDQLQIKREKVHWWSRIAEDLGCA